MHLAILYHPDNEYARATEELAEELKTQTDRKIEFVDVDTREGIERATNYGAVDYPAIVVLTDDGQVYYMWQGSALPTIALIASYLNI